MMSFNVDVDDADADYDDDGGGGGGGGWCGGDDVYSNHSSSQCRRWEGVLSGRCLRSVAHAIYGILQNVQTLNLRPF